MTRLPQPGGDEGDWGNILNDFLSQSHDTIGNLKAGVVGASQVSDGALPQAKIQNLSSDLASKQPLNGNLTTIAALTPNDDDILQRKSGEWTNQSPTQFKSALGLTPSPLVDLTVWLQGFITHIVSNQPYVEPTTQEATDFITGLYALLRGETTSSLITNLGFTITQGYEATTQRPYTLVVNEYDTTRCWGAYLLDMSTATTAQPIRGVIEAPHPVYDAGSEFMALQHWRNSPGTILLISGSHRTDATGTNIRDVAHQPNSLFSKVAVELSKTGLPQLQQHGFADASDPSHDIIVSSGSSNDTGAVHRLADYIEAAGFRVGRNWDGSATTLTGTTNSQGDAAVTAGTVFAHIEVNNTVRSSTTLTATYEAAVQAANYFETQALSHPQLANNVSGQFPLGSGSTNSSGTSVYASRSDHRHRLTVNDVVDGQYVKRQSGGWQAIDIGQIRTDLGLDGLWGAADYGLKSWSADLAVVSQNLAIPAAGTAQVVRLKIPLATTITNIHIHIGSSGSGLSNCFAALYQANTLFAQTSDQSTVWQSAGFKTMVLTTAQAIAAGMIDIVFWAGAGTTLPSLRATASTAAINGNLSNTNSRFATANTGLTTTAPATLGTKTGASTGFWVGVS